MRASAAFARDALSKEPDDVQRERGAPVRRLLMLDDPEGALRAWNKVGKPRLDLVSIEGAHHTIPGGRRSTALEPNTLLTADALRRHSID